jgi:hypothetical protein
MEPLQRALSLAVPLNWSESATGRHIFSGARSSNSPPNQNGKARVRLESAESAERRCSEMTASALINVIVSVTVSYPSVKYVTRDAAVLVSCHATGSTYPTLCVSHSQLLRK